jgi:hypothetical protein
VTNPLDLRNRPQNDQQEALPLPTGTALYESLTARFISFERLLGTLLDTRYSGYVRLVAPDANGVILFRDGQVVDALCRTQSNLAAGDDALQAIERSVEDGTGVLDVVNLERELVTGLHHLASGVPAYPDMRASWVNTEGLVSFLQGRRFTGAVSVRAAAGAGVIMLGDGRITGAFTTESRSLGEDPGPVLALCSDPEAQVEVHAAAEDSGERTRPPETEPVAEAPEPAGFGSFRP